MADFGADVELEKFRAEAREWLEAHFPASLRGRSREAQMEGAAMNDPDYLAWKKAMGEKGWSTPTWPSQYGGGGLTPDQGRVLQAEMRRIGAFNPVFGGMGLAMVGPTILDYGTEEQKQKHIPPLVRGETRWCLGYSEPGAGSDLASLQTRCVDAGDHYVINGQKVWTSEAHLANWCGILVRTDPTAKKQDGISFLLVDMNQPGVEVRPIRLISGNSPFCETFFNDAVAPKDALLGELNKGWSVGKRLLEHERVFQTGGGMVEMGPPATSIAPLAKEYVGVDEQGRIADPELRLKVAQQDMATRAQQLMLARAIAEGGAGGTSTTPVPVLKNAATAVGQGHAELSIELMGGQGLGWEGEGFTDEELQTVRGWLAGRASSIYGGSMEIQNNILVKRVLGLPENSQSG